MKSNNPFEDIFKPLTDALGEISEMVELASSCKARRFYLVRHVDKVLKETAVAEGVVFGDGTVALRWKTVTPSTALFDSVDALLAVHGQHGKAVIKYIDAEPVL